MKNVKHGMIILLLLGWVATATALEPPTPEQVRKYKQEGTWPVRLQDAAAFGNHKMEPGLAVRADYKLRYLYYLNMGKSIPEIDQVMTPPPAWTGMPSKGDVNMFVLLIEFNDYSHISPIDDVSGVDTRVFGVENLGNPSYPYESLSAYYSRASYGLLNLQGATLGWYNPGTDRSAVPETSTGREGLIKSAINSFDAAGHDFSQYDNDGDGDIDYFAVVWAGPHGEWATFWWGYQTSFSDTGYTVDGKTLKKYSWQWESYNYPAGSFSPLVLIHETGHALGLPDYYDYNVNIGPDGGVGNLDMMDGNWGDHNSFSKFVLDWLTPTVISSRGSHGTQTLWSAASYPDALLVMPGATGSAFEEFFMVQHRRRERNDSTYPADGLLIWHVNAVLNDTGSNYAYDNSYTEFKLLRLMEADGLEEIETNSASADIGDFYTPGDTFTHATVPDSASYSGLQTGVQVTGITSPDSSMTCDVSILDVPAVTVTSPSNHEAVSGNVVITASAYSSSGITRVEFFMGSTSLGLDTTAPYSVVWDTSGKENGLYEIRAVAVNTLGIINADQINVFLAKGSSSEALIIDLASDNKSGEGIGLALAMSNIKPVFGSVIGSIDPAVYPVVFVCLGYWAGNHILTYTESENLASYLDKGGRLYMEGAETWAYDPQFSIHGYFGINGIADGVNDLGTIDGNPGGLSEGIRFTSTGFNSYVDRLEVENGGMAIWTNSSPVYICGISRQTDTYRTVGCSFEFGNIPGTDMRAAIMGAYLSFFQGSEKINFLPAVYQLLIND